MVTDNEFDPPYASVGDWWGNLDCRVMRLMTVKTTTILTLRLATTQHRRRRIDGSGR